MVRTIHRFRGESGRQSGPSDLFGSWRFLILQTFLGAWITMNSLQVTRADRQNMRILRAIERNTHVTGQILEHVEWLVRDHAGRTGAKTAAT